MLNHIHFWEKGKTRDNVPLKRNISTYLSNISIEDLVVVNVEHWSLNNISDMVENIPKYNRTFKLIKDIVGDKKVGIYSMFPQRNYWASQKFPPNQKYTDWQKKNNELADIVVDADIVMPSLYTFYPGKRGWVRYAKTHIKESRRLFPNKPVYVFLWPQYHYSNLLHGGKYIDGEFWRLQLQTAYQNADGIIIWGGWDDVSKKHLDWSNNWDWWQETIKFVSELK